MSNDDDRYEIDSAGNRVLIGLSAEETLEFILLDEAISDSRPLPGVSHDECMRMEDRRWLELYEKHEAARRPFMTGSKTRH
jgi:putative sterol carrier protein